MRALGLLLSLSAASPADLDREIERGVALFQRLENRQAVKVLRDALAQRPSPRQEARARLYLGLIAFNSLDPGTAAQEFTLALEADPTAAVAPVDTSVKSDLLLKKIRRRLEAQAAGPRAGTRVVHPPPTAPEDPPERPRLRFTPPDARARLPQDAGGSSHLASYLFGGGALLALGGGILFGQVQAADGRALLGAVDATQATNLGRAVQRDGILADVLFGVAGAAAVTAVVLFFTSSSGEGAVALRVSPNGVVVGVGF